MQKHLPNNDWMWRFIGKDVCSWWSDYVWLNNVSVIKTVARRGHLVWAGECVISAARHQRLSCRHTSVAPQRVSLITVSTLWHTHTHKCAHPEQADTHKTFIEHLNVNLTFFGGKKAIKGLNVLLFFSPLSRPLIQTRDHSSSEYKCHPLPSH